MAVPRRGPARAARRAGAAAQRHGPAGPPAGARPCGRAAAPPWRGSGSGRAKGVCRCSWGGSPGRRAHRGAPTTQSPGIGPGGPPGRPRRPAPCRTAMLAAPAKSSGKKRTQASSRRRAERARRGGQGWPPGSRVGILFADPCEVHRIRVGCGRREGAALAHGPHRRRCSTRPVLSACSARAPGRSGVSEKSGRKRAATVGVPRS